MIAGFTLGFVCGVAACMVIVAILAEWHARRSNKKEEGKP